MRPGGPDIYYIAVIGMVFALLIALAVVLFYIRYQQRLHLQKQTMHEAEIAHQKNLLYAIIQSQEEERKRIGRDLHDDVNAALSNLRMLIQRNTRIAIKEESTTTPAGDYTLLIDKITNDVRHISHNLSPPALELFGFTEAMEELCESFSHASGLEVGFNDYTENLANEIHGSAALHLYRVFQELLNNTFKHANASAVQIDFTEENNELKISYADDGCGFIASEIKKPGMGMQNIESRLGLLQADYSIDSAPGKGFSITIYLNAKQTLAC
jgi:signal transduction histidine kinase